MTSIIGNLALSLFNPRCRANRAVASRNRFITPAASRCRARNPRNHRAVRQSLSIALPHVSLSLRCRSAIIAVSAVALNQHALSRCRRWPSRCQNHRARVMRAVALNRYRGSDRVCQTVLGRAIAQSRMVSLLIALSRKSHCALSYCYRTLITLSLSAQSHQSALSYLALSALSRCITLSAQS
jgi:hypothetical protein